MTSPKKLTTDDFKNGGTTPILEPELEFGEGTQEVFCVRWAPDDNLLAAGCGDGCVRVYSPNSGRLVYILSNDLSRLPITSVRWRPTGPTAKTRNVMLTAGADGRVCHWHVTSGKCLHTIEEEGNQVYALAYRADAAQFVTGGKDFQIRLYDEATKTKIMTLNKGDGKTTTGHSNRAFSVMFDPNDNNTILTGGWDNTIQIWDTRVGLSVRSIFGPHICGDAMDLSENLLITGSWRPDNPLQLWDYTQGTLIENLRWPTRPGEAAMLYAAQFSKNGGKQFAAGGSGTNEMRVFDRLTGQCTGVLAGLPRAVYTLDWSHDSRRIAIGGGEARVRVVLIEGEMDALKQEE
eukprot:Rmarinus@m.18196